MSSSDFSISIPQESYQPKPFPAVVQNSFVRPNVYEMNSTSNNLSTCLTTNQTMRKLENRYIVISVDK